MLIRCQFDLVAWSSWRCENGRLQCHGRDEAGFHIQLRRLSSFLNGKQDRLHAYMCVESGLEKRNKSLWAATI